MRRAAFAAALALACAGVKTYPNDAPPNVRVLTELESGVGAALQIYAVDSACRATDRGALPLHRGSLDVGVAAGRPALLVVTFDTATLFHRHRQTSSDVLFTPRPGARYELAARYADDMYDVTLREVDRRGAHELPHRTLAACKGE